MSLIEGLAYLDRNTSSLWANLPAENRKELLNYAGFDSARWFWENETIEKYKTNIGLVPFDKIEETLPTFLAHAEDSAISCIYITNNLDQPFFAEHFSFAGFDVGVGTEFGDPVFFSGILNEIRHGGNTLLSHLVEKLNNNYLFDSKLECRNYLDLRFLLFQKDETKFLETAFETSAFEVFQIYLYDLR